MEDQDVTKTESGSAAAPPTDTLRAARAMLRAGIYSHGGVVCPCCERLASVYRRRINAGMVRTLLAIAREQRRLPPEAGGWVKVGMNEHLPSGRTPGNTTLLRGVKTAGGDYSKAQWPGWELIEPKPNAQRADGSRRAGYWRVTERGLAFLRGELAVRRYLYEYDGAPVADPPDADTSMVTVGEAYELFSYEEAMRVP